MKIEDDRVQALETERDQWREKFNRAAEQSLVALTRVGELGTEVNRLRDALAALAGRVPQPPDPPDAVPLSAFGSAGYLILDSMVKKFAGQVLDGGDPTADARKGLVDGIVGAVRQALAHVESERDEAREALAAVARECIVPLMLHGTLNVAGIVGSIQELARERTEARSGEHEAVTRLMALDALPTAPEPVADCEAWLASGSCQYADRAVAAERERSIQVCKGIAERHLAYQKRPMAISRLCAGVALHCAREIEGGPAGDVPVRVPGVLACPHCGGRFYKQGPNGTTLCEKCGAAMVESDGFGDAGSESAPAPDPALTSMDPEVMRQLREANRAPVDPDGSGRTAPGFLQMLNAAWAGERDRGVKLCEKRAEQYRAEGLEREMHAAMECAADIRGKR